MPASIGQLAGGHVHYTGNKTITKIVALDMNRNGTGGFVYYINGGIRSTYTTLYFSSIIGGEIDFKVNIYTEGDNDLTIGETNSRSVLVHRYNYI